jgi:hypothetical protein
MSVEIASLVQTATLDASCEFRTAVLMKILRAYDVMLNNTWLLTFKAVSVSYRVKLESSVYLLCSHGYSFLHRLNPKDGGNDHFGNVDN